MKTRRIRIPAALLLAAATSAVLMGAGSATAAPESLFATLKDQGFAPVVTVEGQAARFANLDAQTHQIISTETDAQGDPLFWSDVLGTGEIGAVHGVEVMPARTTPYDFYCPYHVWMKGTLVVSDQPSTN